MQELIEDGYERLIYSSLARMKKAPSSTALGMFLRNHLAFQIVNPHWYAFALIESRHLGDETQEELRSLKTDYALMLEHLLQTRVSKRADARRIATMGRQALRLLDGPPQGDGCRAG